MKRNIFLFAILLFLLLFLILVDLKSGSFSISFTDIFEAIFFGSGDSTVISVVNRIRLPRVFGALIAGGALAVAGLIMQSIFRNPLAGPYILGINAGAGLGVAIVTFGLSAVGINFSSNFGVVFASWIGAFAVLSLIFFVSLRFDDIFVILVIGVLISGTISAIVSVLQFFGSAGQVKNFVVWTMASLSGVSLTDIYILAIISFAALLFSIILSKGLNLIILGDEHAYSLGINTKILRLSAFAVTGILAGTTTAFMGPITYVGLASPHIAKALFKTSNHNILIPASFLTGAIVLIVSDIISLTLITDNVLPLNAVTALTGIPIVIYVLIKSISGRYK